jgi:polyisoprenoid-binding protein YceI
MRTLAIATLAGTFLSLSAFTTDNNGKAKSGKTSEIKLENKTYVAVPAKSKLDWVGKKVTGEHSGAVAIKSGELKTNKNKLVGGSFVIDMTSITCTDLKDAEYNKKLIGHLNSDDFFSVAKHPTATFKATSVQPIKDAKAGEPNYTVAGNLTIKGITNPITFPATLSTEKGELRAKANIVVDRTKYDVKYGSASFFEGIGDKAIYDDFTMNLDMIAR